MLAYENGSFKLVKSQGGKNEDAMDITYTIGEQAAGKATITLSNIDLTTILINEKIKVKLRRLYHGTSKNKRFYLHKR